MRLAEKENDMDNKTAEAVIAEMRKIVYALENIRSLDAEGVGDAEYPFDMPLKQMAQCVRAWLSSYIAAAYPEKESPNDKLRALMSRGSVAGTQRGGHADDEFILYTGEAKGLKIKVLGYEE
jgi:hypothetical protein